MIAAVRGPTAAATASGSAQNEPGSMSAKTGSAPGQADRVRAGRERERRDDHLVAGADPEREQAELQRGRPRVDGHAVPSRDDRGELLLERRDLRPLHDPAAAQDAHRGLDLRLSDMRTRREDGPLRFHGHAHAPQT
ncbi:hypothetical protein LUX57_24960 [Actinomadura madurae]|nr:hypothetical protein [Actinomadura madurae]MCP9967997.1 hypothetical protein [Actinomadura madurae]